MAFLYVGVDKEFQTIQSAIDAALDGDIVVIDEGFYPENLSTLGKYVHIKGNTEDAHKVIIENTPSGYNTPPTTLYTGKYDTTRYVEPQIIEGVTLKCTDRYDWHSAWRGINVGDGTPDHSVIFNRVYFQSNRSNHVLVQYTTHLRLINCKIDKGYKPFNWMNREFSVERCEISVRRYGWGYFRSSSRANPLRYVYIDEPNPDYGVHAGIWFLNTKPDELEPAKSPIVLDFDSTDKISHTNHLDFNYKKIAYLELTAFSGERPNASIQHFSVFSGLGFVNGSSLTNTDLEVPKPIELSIGGVAGEHVEVGIQANPHLSLSVVNGGTSSLSVSSNVSLPLTSSCGSTSTFDCRVPKPIEISMEMSNGSEVKFDITTYQVFKLEPVSYGSRVTFEELNFSPSFKFTSFSGATCELMDLDRASGETISMACYSGGTSSVNVNFQRIANLEFRPIEAGVSLYDGWGGAGGFNFDNQIDESNVFNMDRRGFEVWTTKGGASSRLEIDLQTNPRLMFEIEYGSAAELYIPLKITALYESDVPESRLYQFAYTGLVFDEPTSEQTIEYTTPNSESDIFIYSGDEIEINLSVAKPHWMTSQRPIVCGSNSFMDFESSIYNRFCKGYILPSANSVTFEFNETEQTNCSVMYASGGSAIGGFELYTTKHMYPAVANHGSRAGLILTTSESMRFFAYGGSRAKAHIRDNATFELVGVDGSLGITEFYEPPIYGYGGSASSIESLVVTGPDIEWKTTNKVGIPNDYIPMTLDGDSDKSGLSADENGVVQLPVVPVEFMPYLGILDATCVKKVIDNGD